ncbi:MAG: transposase [Saprospiraceae bacterium]|nr:transposase [Saprospiraceae bacterium]
MKNLSNQMRKMALLRFDIFVKIGEKEKYSVRMIGYKVTEEQAMKKRKKLIQSRHKDSGITEKAYFLCNYNIFITNIPKEQLAAHKMFEIYSLRWSIELMFKEWKSIFDLNALMLSNKTPNPARPEMLLYLMLLYIALVVKPAYYKIAAIIKQKYNKYVSPHKFSNYLKTVSNLGSAEYVGSST